jgi:transposase
MTIPGIGEVTATAVVATVSDAKHFSTSRQFAAWIGLVPKQYSTGGKPTLGRISKRGEKHIHTSLIHDARAVIANCTNKMDRTSLWIKALIERRGFKRAVVALAAKNARLIWSLLQSGNEYQVNYVKT